MRNDLNQLTNIKSGGPTRFAGWINETGLVSVGVQASAWPATMTTFTNFVASVPLVLGSNTVSVVAWDSQNNFATNRYQVIITNGVATTLKYDANGNLTNQYTSTYTNYYDWDAEDRLVRITRRWTADPVEYKHEFIYDGLGRRVQIVERTNGVVATARRYLWCGTEICDRRDSTSATIERQYFAHGEWQNPGKYHYTRDHLGSVRDVVGGFQALQARYDYDPYGRKTAVTENTDIVFGYTGHFSHGGSGLHLALFRALDSGMGRWLSRDPIGEAGGFNLYGYAGNDALNSIDLLGLDTVDNMTDIPIMVYGNPGPGHGTAPFVVFSIAPPHSGYGMMAGWRNPQNALLDYLNRVMDDDCIEGPRHFVPPMDGWLEDVDGFIDLNGTQRRLRGDAYGPNTEITLENGRLVTDSDNIGVFGSVLRNAPRVIRDNIRDIYNRTFR